MIQDRNVSTRHLCESLVPNLTRLPRSKADQLLSQALRSSLQARRAIRVNHQDSAGVSLLTFAAKHNYIQCVKLLLSASNIRLDLEQFSSLDEVNGTALHIAAFKGHLEIMLLLIAKAPKLIDIESINGFFPLHNSILNAKLDAFKLLVKRGADPGKLTGIGTTLRNVPRGINAYALAIYCRDNYTQLNRPVYEKMISCLTASHAKKSKIIQPDYFARYNTTHLYKITTTC